MDQFYLGIVTIIIGLFAIFCGVTKSELLIYRILSARARLTMGEYVHHYFFFAGIAVTVLGIWEILGFGKR
ncbi:hypothetical protein [Rubinisphaera sp.]|uniref:hypothetical protein n=1 Tax=Rubinisphaera sp. TaxID=2024857 RepID=UPI000C11C2F4|nr:hypothetical protein [Rubinisphaera sp.]MBV10079.1 hypothetical protein [Rubinisphaera sp.]HCS50608.1 hypothetical protein [Planctomycetaceae bacterium]|tara:strand:+ start:2217 stop:2429 length:213 start_codon:yes stop_codon:yes gene_type:complete